MNSKSNWKSYYEQEIMRAITARVNGKEGMARVCARRAAAVVIGEYLSRRGYKKLTTSAYERLALFNCLPDVDDQVKVIASHFLIKVSRDHKLPVDIDLISEAKWMMKNLLLESTN